ncbi:MAG: sulfur oxidation c-type cytochrome SoxX [Roseinatronobacter sp.]
MKLAQPILASVAALLISSHAIADTQPADIVWEDDIAVPASLTGVAGNPEEGAKVLANRALGNCVACHVVSAMPNVDFQGDIGPPLDGTGARWSEAELRGILVDAKQVFSDTMMPAFYQNDPTRYTRPGNAYTGDKADDTFSTLLSAQQIEDVIAYLMTLTD